MNVLEYASPQPDPPRWRSALYSFRILFIVGYFAVFVATFVFVREWAVILPLFIITLFQALFLIGMPEIRWPRATRKRSMMISQMIAALAAALLTFGVVATVLCAIDKWESAARSMGANILWIVAIAWFLWLLIFTLMWARQPFSGFTRIYKTIIAGTILEVLITIPVDVQVRKRTSCWCDQGTFYAYIIAICVAFWTFGPGLVLLLLTRKLQRQGYFSLCQKCGQDINATHEKRCPNCNARIPKNHR